MSYFSAVLIKFRLRCSNKLLILNRMQKHISASVLSVLDLHIGMKIIIKLPVLFVEDVVFVPAHMLNGDQKSSFLPASPLSASAVSFMFRFQNVVQDRSMFLKGIFH